MAEKLRVDKWLWSIRIFKSRTLASEVCKKGKVKLQDEKLKPSSLIQVGDRLVVGKNGINYELEVVKLIGKRVSAPLAAECYIDHTPEEELNKFESWYIGKAKSERREKGEGRPTKKQRREIDDFKLGRFK